MSEVSIINAALAKLGAEAILTRNDNTNRARVMNSRYDAVRDAELRRHRWKFSISRDSLAALATTPDSDFGYQYQLPNDFLRLIEGADIVSLANLSDFRGGPPLYQIEGRTILTNLAAPLKIRYIAQIIDTAAFDAAFTESLASRLAYENCKKITGNENEKAGCWEDYRNSLREARMANALESAPQDVADSEWVTARAQ